MKVANCVLAVVLLAMAYYVRSDSLLAGAICLTALLSVLTVFSSVGHVLLRLYAVLNMLLMFFYFYLFFDAIPDMTSRWYVHLENLPIWVVLVGAFASMHILADFSCCLKKDVDETLLANDANSNWEDVVEGEPESGPAS